MSGATTPWVPVSRSTSCSTCSGDGLLFWSRLVDGKRIHKMDYCPDCNPKRYIAMKPPTPAVPAKKATQ